LEFYSFFFKKFSENVGKRVKRFVSGGAPLSAESQEFIRVAFGVPVVQGYGLTETVAGATVQDHDDIGFVTYNVGRPNVSCKIKLVDVPDLKYFSTDTPHPRGEVWIQGGNVSIGYFDDKEKTEEAFTKDGWFKTGDIGLWKSNGTLCIIDRKKNLIKLAHGEYVAIESLESLYCQSKFIAPNGICVYGDSYKNTLVALILPQKSYVEKWASENEVKGNFSELCKNKKLIKEVHDSLKAIAKKK